MNFRSKLEGMVQGLLGAEWMYEPFTVPYVSKHRYTPDFVYTIDGCYEILVEVKGYFRPGDRQKYKAIRDSLDDSRELVFFLSSPQKKVSKGAMLNMGQWCDKEGIKWFFDGQDLKEYAKEVEDGHI
jgi:hypothetical protein